MRFAVWWIVDIRCVVCVGVSEQGGGLAPAPCTSVAKPRPFSDTMSDIVHNKAPGGP
jgi:hypothetical protein